MTALLHHKLPTA